jgi:uncharacterized membrane protein
MDVRALQYMSVRSVQIRMNVSTRNLYLRAGGLGVMAGIRSQTGIWLMSLRANKEQAAFRGTWLGWLGYRQVLALLSFTAIGELIADKIVALPNRNEPFPLFWRALFGGFAGAAAFTEEDRPAILGAAIGAGGAIASSLLFYYLRRAAVRKTGLPDPVVALGEDAALARIAVAVMKTYEQEP